MKDSEQYFDWTFWRIGFALGSYWMICQFRDGTRWRRLGLGFYWRYEGEQCDE